MKLFPRRLIGTTAALMLVASLVFAFGEKEARSDLDLLVFISPELRVVEFSTDADQLRATLPNIAAVDSFRAEHGIDLGSSWAYSDSASDLPMLDLVGNPVVVNPDPELAKIARDRGWQVMRFEKLGRRLAVAGTVIAAGAIGGSGTWLAARGRPRRAPKRFR